MLRRAHDLVGSTIFHGLAMFHYEDAVADTAHHRQIMADEEDCKAQLFFLYECYEAVLNVPVDVFGTWLGQDMIVFESPRAVLEP